MIILPEIAGMKKIIDISITLDSKIPIWPGSLSFELSWAKRMDKGDECNNSMIKCDTHVGTHVDAPFHFFKNGETVENLLPDDFIGPCTVIHLPGVKKITAEQLANANIPSNVERLLIKTDNSKLWISQISEFKKDFVALDPDAAQWIVENGVRLVGIDYLSIGRYNNGNPTHGILLNAGVAVLEGLNLWEIKPGNYELICLPLKIAGAEGAPARAVLRR